MRCRLLGDQMAGLRLILDTSVSRTLGLTLSKHENCILGKPILASAKVGLSGLKNSRFNDRESILPRDCQSLRFF